MKPLVLSFVLFICLFSPSFLGALEGEGQESRGQIKAPLSIPPDAYEAELRASHDSLLTVLKSDLSNTPEMQRAYENLIRTLMNYNTNKPPGQRLIMSDLLNGSFLTSREHGHFSEIFKRANIGKVMTILSANGEDIFPLSVSREERLERIKKYFGWPPQDVQSSIDVARKFITPGMGEPEKEILFRDAYYLMHKLKMTIIDERKDVVARYPALCAGLESMDALKITIRMVRLAPDCIKAIADHADTFFSNGRMDVETRVRFLSTIEHFHMEERAGPLIAAQINYIGNAFMAIAEEVSPGRLPDILLQWINAGMVDGIK